MRNGTAKAASTICQGIFFQSRFTVVHIENIISAAKLIKKEQTDKKIVAYNSFDESRHLLDIEEIVLV